MNGGDVHIIVITSQEIRYTLPLCHAPDLCTFPRRSWRALFWSWLWTSLWWMLSASPRLSTRSPHSFFLSLCVRNTLPYPLFSKEKERAHVSNKCYVGMVGVTLVSCVEMFKWTYVCVELPWPFVTRLPCLWYVNPSLFLCFQWSHHLKSARVNPWVLGFWHCTKAHGLGRDPVTVLVRGGGHLFYLVFFFTSTKITFIFKQSIGLNQIRCPMDGKQSSENDTHFCVHT